MIIGYRCGYMVPVCPLSSQWTSAKEVLTDFGIFSLFLKTCLAKQLRSWEILDAFGNQRILLIKFMLFHLLLACYQGKNKYL